LPLAGPLAVDLDARLLPPLSEGHVLGTDHLGRDILSRLVWGARSTLAVAAGATLFAAVTGSLLGLVAGYFPGLTDNVLMRGVDVLMAFPYMLLALAIVAALGPGIENALLAVAIVNIPFFARAVRGAAVGQVSQDYVKAARLSGQPTVRILLAEVLPNVMPTIVVTMATTVGWMILETAGLSFLGLGAQPPSPDLGAMLGEGRRVFVAAPHVATVPGAAILVLVMAINLVSDGVRDAIDPRLAAGSLARPSAATPVVAAAQPASGEDSPVLRVSDLTVRFDTAAEPVTAVDGLDLELHAGECLGLVGASGSGKSVTALALARLVPSPPGRIAGGSIVLDGQDVLAATPADLRALRGRRIGYVFQDPSTSLNPLYPVGEQVAEALRHGQGLRRRAAWRRAVELLAEVELDNAETRAGAYPHQLSGGQRQRAAIAVAIANDPAVLIADEPTTALDVGIQARVLRLLDRLRRERGTALLFITHDLGLVRQICDRVMVLRDGRCVEAGATEHLLSDPQDDYTRALLKAAPRLPRRKEAAGEDGDG
jgi:peptide/nickel transport system permease protein